MRALDIFGAGGRIFAVEIRVRGPIDGILPIDHSAEGRGELLVRGIAASPECITTNGGHGVVMKMCYSSRLFFVDQITVPS